LIPAPDGRTAARAVSAGFLVSAWHQRVQRLAIPPGLQGAAL
jgi:hypothetical protein